MNRPPHRSLLGIERPPPPPVRVDASALLDLLVLDSVLAVVRHIGHAGSAVVKYLVAVIWLARLGRSSKSRPTPRPPGLIVAIARVLVRSALARTLLRTKKLAQLAVADTRRVLALVLDLVRVLALVRALRLDLDPHAAAAILGQRLGRWRQRRSALS